jgi:hypothetical protein
MLNAQTKIALAFTAGVCVGGGIGYLIADHQIKKLAAADLEAVQAMFRRVRDEDAQKSEPMDEIQADDAEEDSYQTPAQGIAAEEIIRLGYATEDSLMVSRVVKRNPNYLPPEPQEYGDEDLSSEEDPDLEEEVDYVRRVTHNPTHEPDPDDVTSWDRSPLHPYVITESEYRIDRPEYEKDSLTYYVGDDTLAEENGNYIPDKNGTAGNQNLREFFGYGSGNERLLYIRNDRVMADFEINLNDGKYTKEVLDVDDEEDAPPRRHIKKMRRGE